MINVILIDDEPLARALVKEYLSDHKEFSVVQECNDGFEGVKAITQHQPQLIFLDVQMPKITGFEMLELLDDAPAVIFTTAFDEYAIKAFEAQAIDYLLKPFSKERFDKAIEKWRVQFNAAGKNNDTKVQTPVLSIQPEEQNRIVIKSGSNIKIIPVKDIIYLEAYDDYVKIFTQEGMFLKKKTMAHYEQTLSDKQFVRVHRSYLVQLPFITKIEPMEKDNHIVILKNGTKIPASRSGFAKLKEILNV
jgi:two-component system LytT family response regulator